MFWWKNDSGGAVLGSSGGGQEISETKIMIGSSKLLIFEHHSVRYTQLFCSTFIHRWLEKYFDIYDNWYHRKWGETGGKSHASNVH